MRRAVAIVLAAGLAAGAARAAVTPDDIKRQLESAYHVEVLRVEPIELAGKPAFTVRVMKKQSGGNDAFRVTTLAVDGETGQLISAFHHRASGYALSDAPAVEPKQIIVPEQGMRTWR